MESGGNGCNVTLEADIVFWCINRSFRKAYERFINSSFSVLLPVLSLLSNGVLLRENRLLELFWLQPIIGITCLMLDWKSVVFFDYSKAFDTVPHRCLLLKMENKYSSSYLEMDLTLPLWEKSVCLCRRLLIMLEICPSTGLSFGAYFVYLLYK